ncbi:hypothetical protein CLAIMM_14843 isoform 2 [Cladophialophora immunda]|nr:hypothetical protein CLAIMM_14843 isoform 2 [Cladophialophora immunda]
MTWPLEATAEMLCALDQLLRSSGSAPVEKIVLLRSVQRLLKRRRSHAQISGKLKHLVSQYGNHDAKRKPEVIYKFGTECLRGLPHDLKQEILQKRAIIRDAHVTLCLSTESRLRSGSKRVRSPYGSRTSTIDLGNRSASKTRSQSATCSPSIRLEPFRPESGSKRTSAVTKNLGSSLRASRRSTRLLSVASVDDSEDCIDLDATSHEVKGNTPDHDPSFSRLSTLPFPEKLRSQDAATPSVLQYEDPGLFQHSVAGQTVDQLYQLVRDLYRDNLLFQDRLLQTKVELERLSAADRRAKSVSKRMTENKGESIRVVLDSQLQTIKDLEKQKRNHSFLKPFLCLQSGEPPILDLESLQQDFIGLKKCFNSLLTLASFHYPEAGGDAHAKDSIASLLQASLQGSQALQSAETHIPARMMVLSIVGAALYRWVFSAEVQCTAMIPTPLLHEYRRHLESVCDKVALGNLDLAARKSLITGKHFQEVTLRTSASNLTKKLFAVVSVFIEQKLSQERVSKVKDHLELISLSALRINSHRLLYDKAFEPIWPAPQETFDVERMTTRLESQMCIEDACSSDSRDMRVKISLVPGIRICNRDQIVDLKAVVDVTERP